MTSRFIYDRVIALELICASLEMARSLEERGRPHTEAVDAAVSKVREGTAILEKLLEPAETNALTSWRKH